MLSLTRRLLGMALLISAVACKSPGQEKLHTLIVQGHDYLQARQAENEAEYHLSTFPHYDWHQDSGEIVFSSDTEAKVVASIQIVGDVSKHSQTWLWAWANTTVTEPLRKAANAVREIGEREKIDRLTKEQWPAVETNGWEMTAVAAKLTRASGAYRTCGDSGCVFMLLTNIRWAAPGTLVPHGEHSK